MILIILLLLAATTAYYVLKYHYDHWKRLGVPGPKPRFISGNMGESFLMKKSMGEVFTDIYNKYPNLSIVGAFRGSTPTLIIRDPELIKEVLVKEFSSFHDNEIEINVKVDPLLGRHPFALTGEKWKIARGQLTPCFTSGKIKSIYPLLEEIGEQLVKFIGNQPHVTLEAKELCTKFTLNNVASCAFGLDGNCFEDPNCEFRQIAKRFLSPDAWSTLKIFLATIMPWLSKVFTIKFVPKEVEERITNLVGQTLKYRDDNNIVRNDFLQIISQLKHTSTEYKFDDTDVAAHAAGFFGDGYETSSIVMSFLLYNLASNLEAQAILRKEVTEKFVENGNSLPYDVIQNMPYLDACLNESLRIHPPALFLMKLCTESYTFDSKLGDGIEKVTIEAGTSITLPTFGLQNDPKYFENPRRYFPERFIGTNKERLSKFTFLPFGEGPRACLGKRFGVLQVKVGVAHIIKNYELSVNKKTQTPLKYDPVYFLLSPIGGLWIDFKKVA